MSTERRTAGATLVVRHFAALQVELFHQHVEVGLRLLHALLDLLLHIAELLGRAVATNLTLELAATSASVRTCAGSSPSSFRMW
ncbi:MAG: hypothetical protein WDO56_21035 [Gammaproteobacteria bacterium]